MAARSRRAISAAVSVRRSRRLSTMVMRPVFGVELTSPTPNTESTPATSGPLRHQEVQDDRRNQRRQRDREHGGLPAHDPGEAALIQREALPEHPLGGFEQS